MYEHKHHESKVSNTNFNNNLAGIFNEHSYFSSDQLYFEQV